MDTNTNGGSNSHDAAFGASSLTLHEQLDLEAGKPTVEYGPTYVNAVPPTTEKVVVEIDASTKEAIPPEIIEEVVKEVKDALQDQSNFLPARQVILVFVGLALALACSFLEQTMMATSLPVISSDLNSGSQASWIITAYLLASTAITPISSRFSDIFGRKIAMLFCLGWFWVFSLACAVAQTTTQMIVFRALAGMGGGCLINLALIIISDVVSLRDRGKYQGIFEVVGAVSGGIGPLIGGALAEYNWRWIFWVCVIICAFAMLMVWKILPLKKVTGDVKQKVLQIDGIGCALVVAGSVLILLGLNWGNVVYPWVSGPVLATLLIGVAVLGAFVLYEAKVPKIPIVPMSIFKDRTVIGILLMTTCMGAMQYCLLFYIPQWYQIVRGYSTLQSGLLLLPYLCVIAPTIVICAQLVTRLGVYRPFIYVGVVILAVAMGLFTTLDRTTPQPTVLGFQALAGIGCGCIFQTSLSALQAAVPRHDVAVATGFRNFMRLLSGTIFLAIGSSIINQSITNIGLSQDLLTQILNDPPSIHTITTISEATREDIINAYQGGFRSVFYVLVGCSAFSAVCAYTMVQHHSLNREDDAKLKAEGHKFMEERKERKKGKKGDHHGAERDAEKGEP